MRFQRLLASRYISSQKRHSALTICSIVIAVALMTMLFTCYGTFIKCLRTASYDSAPYHYRFLQVNQKQADILKSLEQTETYNITKNSDGTYQVDLIFKKNSMGDSLTFDQELAKKLDISWFDEYYTILDCNNSLMNYDMINDSAKFNQLRLFCIFFILVVCFALILRLMIDTAFEISSKERERQFGVLQSIGATPKQIVGIITAEGLTLSVIGLPIGLIIGVVVAYLAFKAVLSSGVADAFFTSEKAEQLVQFHISPLMLLVSAIVGFAWVMFSAYGTGMRIIKMSPVEAISNRSNKVKKVRRHTLTGIIFGWIGKLASRNARRQKKRFTITILSLTLSITLFASLGTTLSSFIDIEEAILIETFGTNDFDVLFTYPHNEPLGYREPLKKILNSGYFQSVEMTISKVMFCTIDGQSKPVIIEYQSKDDYNNFFGENPPVSYDELIGTKNYVFAGTTEEPESISSITANIEKRVVPDELMEKYSSYYTDKSEDNLYYINHMAYSDIFKDLKNNYPDNITKEDHIFNIVATGKEDFSKYPSLINNYETEVENTLFLIATLEQFEDGEYEMYGNLSYTPNIDLKLISDDKYTSALHLIENDSDLDIYMDNYIEAKKLRTTTSAISIGSTFLIAIIALSAIVNMINIISTGIINRRSELASMQCVGMTRGQLNRMVIVEAIQYTIISVIGAVIICFLILKGTESFIVGIELLPPDSISSFLSFGDILWRIGLFAVPALIVSILAAILPIQGMQKKSLVEQIRTTE